MPVRNNFQISSKKTKEIESKFVDNILLAADMIGISILIIPLMFMPDKLFDKVMGNAVLRRSIIVGLSLVGIGALALHSVLGN